MCKIESCYSFIVDMAEFGVKTKHAWHFRVLVQCFQCKSGIRFISDKGVYQIQVDLHSSYLALFRAIEAEIWLHLTGY